MRLALFLPSVPTEMWRLAVQLGVTEAVTNLPQARVGAPFSWDFHSFVLLKQRFADAGLNVAVVESSPPMDRIRLGLPGRDEEIDAVSEMLTAMGAAGIPVWCYNWMAVFGWMRTSTTIRDRGGALVSGYDNTLMANAPLTEAGIVSEERLWENFGYFLERIVPVAEQARVKLALHPDDPPLSPIRGVARIFRSVDAFTRAVELVRSPANGITFCQGNFSAMGADIPAAVEHFAQLGCIHFVHFRDVRGTADHFVETFHDDGPTDMLGAMRSYQRAGFTGVMRPDHVPTLEGDSNDEPGYTTRGRLHAIGYMRGLQEAVRAEQKARV